MTAARRLVDTLRDPRAASGFGARHWNGLIAAARAERLIGALADRLDGRGVPDEVAAVLADARSAAEQERRAALWEADCARRALADYEGKAVLLKGTAYVAADLAAGRGRSIGDLDLLVAEDDLEKVEAALLGAGWEWVKENAYDDQYYRRWMHELPPLIHRTRDRMIDVHHTILPRTARPTPDAKAMLGSAIALEPDAEQKGVRLAKFSSWHGLHVLSPADMVVHSIAHLFADGELDGGLRNLWDIDRMLREFAVAPNFWDALAVRARRHQLLPFVRRALRLSERIYGTPVDGKLKGKPSPFDPWYEKRLMARDGWGRPTRRWLRFAFTLRGHWLRMPPIMLARHLWTKWRRGRERSA
ncbi:nucleotidyltransferase family protein [Novosphingopyxis sp.]|uniref:nucleotidyltransferase domain-containing protein n=1 Tax=Novosphingopyxis sp. TaxID=2709690 RepID=UPI003B5CCEB9